VQLRSGLPEVPCVKCGRRIRGLGWGELCRDCLAERKRRASRLANRISLAATVLMAAYVAIRVTAAPMARLYGGIAVLATYIIVRRIATQVAMEYLPK
jgi:16S rRNA A1518/A1519 N6-dimethyltransferase RsmA/KsgA/DIM1 with predicted DNA glycosylase/AP lyase activity